MNSSNKTMVPEAQDAMNRFKMEAQTKSASTSSRAITATSPPARRAPSAAQMVKKMIKSYEESMK